MEVLVFGGTVEGRLLVEWLDGRGSCQVVACTATEYGASLVAQGRNVQVVQGPLSAQQKDDLMAAHDFCCIVDATHPYATHISESVAALAKAHHKDLLRIERPDAAPGAGITVGSMDEAAAYVAGTQGNVLLTTGSKDLASFVGALPDFQDRLYVRILPVRASLDHVLALGVPPKHIVAMQGPFSAALNEALLRELDIACMVTKQSGPAGGFQQKAEAAQACGVELVVVERPAPAGGVSLNEAKSLLEECYGA